MKIIEELGREYEEDIISNLIVIAIRNSEVFRNIIGLENLEKY